MKKRLLVLAAFLLGWGITAFLLSDFSPLQVVRVPTVPTRTPKATFTATNTPTITLTPSSTPTPTHTATVAPVPTDTPLPTWTPTLTPAPTDTDTPTPTVTPTDTRPPPTLPTVTATRAAAPTNTPLPRPTNTPAPPFTGRIVAGYTNCSGYAGVTGFVRHANGDPYPGVAVGVWSDVWEGRVSESEANGKYELPLTGIPPGAFTVAVVRLETCSQQGGRTTAKDCRFISNIVGGVFTTADCQGEGANQVTEIEFAGP